MTLAHKPIDSAKENQKAIIVCLDLEGVLIPEIWVGLADKTQIPELRLTTRDVPDYNVLMRSRLEILRKHRLKLTDIKQVVSTLEPLEGALEFMAWLRNQAEVIILSDTFRDFAMPMMVKLSHPTLFCHRLIIDNEDNIVDYQLRQEDQKSKAVHALQSLNFKIVAAGDSYNDVGMLKAADQGLFYRPTLKITQEFPQFPVTQNYSELKQQLIHFCGFVTK